MSNEVELYDGYYGGLSGDLQTEMRRETYGEDLGQASWITLAEAHEVFGLLELAPGKTALEVACGSGGVTCLMAAETGAGCFGVDLNPHGIVAAEKRAREGNLSSQVSFRVADAKKSLPFPDEAFDAIFCNDSINHLPDRAAILSDWYRLLRPGGRLLYTDPIVVTGQLTNEEIRARSSIGFFVFTPVGVNEDLLAQQGFDIHEVRDVTDAVAEVSGRWRDAREKRRDRLVATEGEAGFHGVQRFLDAVHLLSRERRLSRFLYLASKPGSARSQEEG